MNTAIHALALYLDTSVIGGYFDAEFMGATRALWRLRDAGRFRFITSQLVFQEIAGAPKRVREPTRASFTPDDVLERTAEVEELARAYLAQKVAPGV